MTVDVADVLLDELQAAAAESKLTLHTFIAEVLESYAAGRRLPRFRSAVAHDPRQVSAKQHDAFPWPETVYQRAPATMIEVIILSRLSDNPELLNLRFAPDF